MNPSVILFVVAGLLLLASVSEPLAARLRIPFSVLLAGMGILIGTASALILHFNFSEISSRLARLIVDFPIGSQAFMVVFLPILLFQTAMSVAARQMVEDWAPILVLAVVAVIVATFLIGFALDAVSNVPLLACLLLGATVATTDPVAVVGIFREVGAPARLGRLVEGESLLNDAAAVTLFLVFLNLIGAPGAIDEWAIGVGFLVSVIGGGVLGVVIARACIGMLPILRENPLAQVSLSVALPFLVFIIGEQVFHVSGVVGVVAAGLTFNLMGPSRISPDVWRHLRGVWEQLDYWASSLVFVLASLLVPKMLSGLGLEDLLLLAVLIAAALAARALILFGLLPALSALRLSPPVELSYRAVMLWGGLRGAMTLALALSVLENHALPHEVQRFAAVLATGFVLFTLLVQGTTMGPLIRLLRLDRLSPLDRALRDQVLGAARRDVADSVAKLAERYGLRPSAAVPVAQDERAGAEPLPRLSLEEYMRVGAVALAWRERDRILDHFRHRTVSGERIQVLLTEAERLIECARTGGLDGYEAEAARGLRFPWRFRIAQVLHRHFRRDRLLARLVAQRFEILLIRRMMLEDLAAFVREKLQPVLGPHIAERLNAYLSARGNDVARGLDALRLQYPGYAEALERHFLVKAALRQEELEYERLHDEGLIGPELYRHLRREIEAHREVAARRPRLDLALDTRTLVAKLPALEGASEAELDAICRRLKPLFAVPGECLIRKGTRGDAAYLIASGAVEVHAPTGRVLLGRGDLFGELALLTEERRSADVTSMAFSSLLCLSRRDFRDFLAENPRFAARIEATAQQRLQENRSAGMTPSLAH